MPGKVASMKARLLASIIVVSAIAVQSQAAMMAYLSIKGQKQGNFVGGILQRGREGKIGVIAVDHDITSPRDARSGQSSGRRMHKPLKVTLELDRATPLIYNALSTNENLPEVTLDFWGPSLKASTGVGVEVQHYSIKLTNATISDVHFVMPNIRIAENARLTEMIEVSFTYQKIEWIWKDGGIMATDDWGN